MNKIIMHIDMNAFFASVEQQINPAFRGKPIAVIGSNERTVITTSSYEARAYGVKTGMTKYEAKRLCPHIVLVAGDTGRYTDTCRSLVEIYRQYTPMVEVYSIDEAFLDVTESIPLFGCAEVIAKKIKEDIRQKLGMLTCSIGIAPNKLLAKLGSDMKKPNGLVVIQQEDVGKLLQNLPVKELCGIGSRIETQLATLGIKTCGELGRASTHTLRNRFGVIGERLKLMAQGIDNNPVIPPEQEPDVKSIGHSMTLDKDVSDMETLECHVLQLSEMVGRRMRRGGYTGRTITLTLRYPDFTTFTKRTTAGTHTDNSIDIYRIAIDILNTVRLQQPIRLIGISISNLTKNLSQIPLFLSDRNKKAATRAMDKINDRYGDFCITWGTLIKRYQHKGVISPSWRPSGIKCINLSTRKTKK
ncbi:MAG: DNA polymerase IV [Planctomycetia bacterium]|nr:DNA polymerase IV [Candidatus Brocadia sp.]QOJ06733.1 MAG: DNA polymerase IV [Planctomycetia bacterium]TVL94930.1 MAG: DNA polymerase IV [Candidatus Brocadia sp. BL1]HQU32108.1 DNA polymerase IV [Candidatus Brocadia sapporoensis]